MSRGPDAGVMLERALVASARTASCPVTIESADWKRWASATFTGARHELVLRGGCGAALDDWLAALPEVDLPLGRYLLADLVVASVVRAEGEARIALEALTVEA